MRDFHKKCYIKGNQLEINDVVLIQDDKAPRHRWNLGKVVELVEGKDGILRGARVLVGKTGSIIGRPLNKLCHLEIKKVDSNMISSK